MPRLSIESLVPPRKEAWMEEKAWDRLPMEHIDYDGGTGDRFVLLVVTKRYGGDPVSPLYERQARALMKQESKKGCLTRLIRLSPAGPPIIESDF
jgi:hypothetical protein